MIKYLWLFCLIPTLLYGAAGDVASVSGKAVTAISTVSGVAGASIATLCGKSYSDGDATCTTEAQSCTTSNNVADNGMGTYLWKASKFAASGDMTVCKIEVNLKKVGTPTHNITVHIYGSTGTEPNEADIIDSSDTVSASTLTTSYAYITFTGLSAELTSGTEYWLVIQNAAGDGSNYVAGQVDTGCDYEEGTLYSSNGTTWGHSDYDRGFKYRLYE